MARRSDAEKRLLEKARRYLPGGNGGNLALPTELDFLASRGQGARIFDVSGNEYVDWLMGSGPMILGHAHPAVTEAVIKAVEGGSTFFATNDKAVELAEEMVNAIPCAEQVRFTTSGTDACFNAMRACRAFTGKEKVLKFEGGFHGTSDYALMSLTPPPSVEYPQAQASSGGIPKAIEDLMLIAPYNDLGTTETIIKAHLEDIAAVIVEPVQRVIAPQPGFLQGLRDLTKRYNIPLIFDEVVTSFRLAYGGAQEFYGVTPDICTVGKIMGGGYPLAAVTGRADILSVYDRSASDNDTYVNQIGTLNGNPVACAAGLATLEVMREPATYTKIHGAGAAIRNALVDICQQNGVPVQSCGEDAIFDVYFSEQPISNYRDTLSADSAMMTRFNTGLLERGILKGAQKYYPSAVHSDNDVEKTIQAIQEVVPLIRS
ncbi:MAG: aminotransferase class III-fold pyridoxal phosphate-dependent enzyme [Chloroflexota bacterium]|nr:aminotransferase class III-fold pyridoxal phosphate-dependent enzyme [Dehalococcoidia bacterium]MEC8959994.1 aminotransferase class III-fold pyridoxal phosphate-dependent enzyme [Chloroflexota bacterium]MEC9288626.1 aminotransferase class III-fold pyridoxal phosphate-dependent enzyme [Chloroflexota bacterium]MEE3248036.1 aminotransferase class III-fold pyridoxal phosphate-dependent enzyme [Chloroflexota bacterium]|tara:strand:+ start:283 stop:1575 length:1293 start_codon:yes stop_codon:yes gene_type:complete